MKLPYPLFNTLGMKSLYQPLVALLFLFGTAPAQTGPSPGAATAPEPRREQLLNGLRILLHNRPGDPQVMLRLRLHSGAAFDLAGREGLMALLGDTLFPDPATRQYVVEDLGGELEVKTGYDAIDVTLTGRATEVERLVELLMNAVGRQPSPETIGRLREARARAVREVSAAPHSIADQAILTRLFGTYPYGRTVGGVPETLARIDRSDLLLARERFLNPNNATLVLIGGFERPRVMRALRQFLGAWRKSEGVVPATFRQPDAPDARTLIVDRPGMPDAEVRLALRGVGRTDRDLAAATVLALLARERWMAASPLLKESAFFVRHDAHALGGVFWMGASVPSSAAAGALESARKVLGELAGAPPSSAELETAKRSSLAVISKELERAGWLADNWLDAQTYNSVSATKEALAGAVGALTPGDVQRAAARLFRDAPAAAVAVGDAAHLRAELSRTGPTEVLGAEVAPVKPARPADAQSVPPPGRRP